MSAYHWNASRILIGDIYNLILSFFLCICVISSGLCELTFRYDVQLFVSLSPSATLAVPAPGVAPTTADLARMAAWGVGKLWPGPAAERWSVPSAARGMVLCGCVATPAQPYCFSPASTLLAVVTSRDAAMTSAPTLLITAVPDKAPATPPVISVVAVSGSDITLLLQAPASPNGLLTTMTATTVDVTPPLLVTTTLTPPLAAPRTVTVRPFSSTEADVLASNGTVTVLVAGLHAYRNYTIDVTVATSAGTSPAVSVNVSTPITAAPRMTGLTVEVQDTLVIFRWPPGDAQNGPISSYALIADYVTPARNGTLLYHGPDLSFAAADMTLAVRSVRVAALNAAGAGPMSDTARHVSQSTSAALSASGVAGVTIAVCVACVAVVLLGYRRYRSARASASFAADAVKFAIAPMGEWEVARSRVEVHSVVGNGAFGVVYSGTLVEDTRSRSNTVAGGGQAGKGAKGEKGKGDKAKSKAAAAPKGTQRGRPDAAPTLAQSGVVNHGTLRQMPAMPSAAVLAGLTSSPRATLSVPAQQSAALPGMRAMAANTIVVAVKQCARRVLTVEDRDLFVDELRIHKKLSSPWHKNVRKTLFMLTLTRVGSPAAGRVHAGRAVADHH